MSDKGAIAQFSSNIKTYRAVIGSVIIGAYVAAYLYMWAAMDSAPTGLQAWLFSLVVVVSLIGLYGEGAVKAAKKIIK